ncbi:hypothetical protein MHYP_G00262380 [Metynnis hypsauchen]
MGLSIMKSLVFIAFCLQLASAATHSMQYFYTAVTGLDFPEFTTVGLVDGEPFTYYDSVIGKETPRTEWIKKVVEYEAGYWDRQTQITQGTQVAFKANVANLMGRFNQTGGEYKHTESSKH